MTINNGKLYIVFKLEPNTVRFIENNGKQLRMNENDSSAIKNFIADKDGTWTSNLFNFIRTNSPAICGDNISDWFESSKIVSTITTIKSHTNNINITGPISDYNDKFESAVIKLNPNHSHFDMDNFIKLIDIVRAIINDKSLMAKGSFVFNNRNNCVCLFNTNKNEFYISEKSKRYLTNKELNECLELVKYLNDWISQHHNR